MTSVVLTQADGGNLEVADDLDGGQDGEITADADFIDDTPSDGPGADLDSDAVVCDPDVCPCSQNIAVCGGVCVDIGTDAAHCGACDVNCNGATGTEATGSTCVDGACAYACKANKADCDPTREGCETDTNKSAENCGACGSACNEGMICHAGACECEGVVCAPEEACCNLLCSNIMSDDAHCGGCNIACDTASEQCLEGICVPR